MEIEFSQASQDIEFPKDAIVQVDYGFEDFKWMNQFNDILTFFIVR